MSHSAETAWRKDRLFCAAAFASASLQAVVPDVRDEIVGVVTAQQKKDIIVDSDPGSFNLSGAGQHLRRRDELNVVRARDRKCRRNKACHHQDRRHFASILAMIEHRYDATEEKNRGQCDPPSAQTWLREH